MPWAHQTGDRIGSKGEWQINAYHYGGFDTRREAEEHLDAQAERADRRNLTIQARVLLDVPADELPDEPTFVLATDRPEPEPEPYVPQVGDIIRHRAWASNQVLEVLYVGHIRIFGRLMGASPDGRRLTGGGAEGSYILDQPGAWTKVR